MNTENNRNNKTTENNRKQPENTEKQLPFHIIGTHFNNVLIWFTKQILGTVFLCPYNVCPK